MAPAATLDPQPDKPQQAAMPATDLVASLPAPFLRLLILFATPIATLRTALEIVFWTPERRVESYLLVGGWWAFCLGFGYAFAWLIPPLVFAPLFPLGRLRLNSTPAPTHTIPATPATTETILVTVGDLHSISAIIPPSPVPHMSVIYNRFHQLGPWRLLRGLLVLWATWVVLGYALGTRVLVAITGSILLLLPSPPLAYVVNLLKKSLAVRRLVALTFILVFGSPERNYVFGSPMGWLKSKWYWSQHPAEALAFERVLDEAEEEELAAGTQAGNPVYFRFELHENQRWWMGLDWTSALLPQERPSWCDSHILPVSPPVAFTLPPPTSIDLPAPTRNEPRAQVRRTAAWRWLDDDWSVVRTGSGATASTAPATIVGMSSPSPTDDSSSDTRSIASIDLPRSSSRDSAASKQPRPSSGIFGSSPPQDDGHTRSPSMAEQAFAKGLGRLKNVNVPLASPVVSPTKAPSVRGRTGSEASGGGDVSIDDVVAGATPSGDAPIAPVDDATDADGWVYGDNKWENMTARGGLGKFTRRRRWQRRAVCTETVQRIPDLAPLPNTDDGDMDAGSGAATPVPAGYKAAPTTTTTTTTTTTSSATAGVTNSTSTGSLKTSAAGVSVEPKSMSADARTANSGPAIAPAPSSMVPAGPGSARDEQLRQRLKKAMGSMGA